MSWTSTEQPARSSATKSLDVTTLRRSWQSRIFLILLRRQRSSPCGSFGPSHRSAQRRLRPTRIPGQREVGPDGAHLARRGKLQHRPVRNDRQGPEHPYAKSRIFGCTGRTKQIPRAFPRLLPRPRHHPILSSQIERPYPAPAAGSSTDPLSARRAGATGISAGRNPDTSPGNVWLILAQGDQSCRLKQRQGDSIHRIAVVGFDGFF